MTGIERVEVFRGPSAFLNGALPSAVGGTINLVPKRATDDADHAGRPLSTIPTRSSAVPPTSAAASGRTTRSVCAPAPPITQRRHGRQQPDRRAPGADAWASTSVASGPVSTATSATCAATSRPSRAASSWRPASSSRRRPMPAKLIPAMGAPAGQRRLRRAALRARHPRRPHRLPQGRRASAATTPRALLQPEHRQLQRQHDDPLGRPVHVRPPRRSPLETGLRGIFNTGPIKHEAALVGDY